MKVPHFRKDTEEKQDRQGEILILRLQVPHEVGLYLVELKLRGLHGLTVEDAAARLICEGIERRIVNKYLEPL